LNSNNRESLYDYLARLNIEGKRTIWAKNRAKINSIYLKTRKYFNNAVNVCEVGIGEGYLLRLLHRDGFKVTGVDISRYLVNELKKKFDIISYIIQKIFKTIFRKRIYTTVYFVARINKS